MNAKLSLCAFALLWVLGTWAQASPVVPGGPAVPPTLVGDTPTLLASLTTPLAPPDGAYTGTLTSAVYRDAGGTLEFDYQFANAASSKDAISRMTMTPFTGFTTDADYRLIPLPPFAVPTTPLPPQTADRSLAGDTVGFNFRSDLLPLAVTEILPGQTSDIVVIKTNATNFDAGFASVIDGAGMTVPSFAPTAPVPAPASAWAGLVLLGGFGVWRVIRRVRVWPTL